MKQSGFTLVELVVVITIVMILATIAVTSFRSTDDIAKDKAQIRKECNDQGNVFSESSKMCKTKFEYCADISKDAAILQICLDQLK